jgi:hypothetical protein
VLCSAYRPSSKDVGKQDAKAVREKIEQRELEPEALRMKVKTLGKLVQSRKDVQRARSQARSWTLLERLGAVFGWSVYILTACNCWAWVKQEFEAEMKKMEIARSRGSTGEAGRAEEGAGRCSGLIPDL